MLPCCHIAILGVMTGQSYTGIFMENQRIILIWLQYIAGMGPSCTTAHTCSARRLLLTSAMTSQPAPAHHRATKSTVMPCDAYVAHRCTTCTTCSFQTYPGTVRGDPGSKKGMAWSQNAHTLANASKGCWEDQTSVNMNLPLPIHKIIIIWYVHELSRTCFLWGLCS